LVELERTIALFHRLLKSGGLLLVNDVVTPGEPVIAGSWARLRFGWRDGSLP
jgi:hypothetical protein